MSEPKEWTLMFYFASDNALAPEVVSQLKSIKNAGYHHDVNVIAYFDPQPTGTPAHIFDVNAIYKLKRPHDNDIGFASDDPFIRNLIDDRLWGSETSRDGKKPIRKLLVDRYAKQDITYTLPPVTNDDVNADDNEKSLRSFLDFCARAYPAEHYMLFILGHGLVVGDDIFLFDEHTAKHSVTLRELGDALTDFKTKIGSAEFELVSFHSCSMSSLEVAFQLQGTANYMMASQGPAFVGSWPYRQILLRVFKNVAESEFKTSDKNKKTARVKRMVGKIFDYVYFNSADYLLAGYSFALSLCDLSESKIGALKGPINRLSKALVDGLKDENNPLVNYSILLAHWKSQSYFQENYTDLFDFCFCLECYCGDFIKAAKDPDSTPFEGIQTACREVMDVLKKQGSDHPDRPVDPGEAVVPDHAVDSNSPVIRAKFVGPDSQYSHGFSVFFPWARPTADRKIMEEYERYNFNKTNQDDLDKTTWLNFLNQYWGPQTHKDEVKGSTMRDSHKFEDDTVAQANGRTPGSESEDAKLDEDIASLMFNAEGPLNTNGALSEPEKPNPQSSIGDGCTCGSIKNYRRDTRRRSERGKSANPTYQVIPKPFEQKKI